MSETWNECSLYKRYVETKIIYLSEIREERERQDRERRLMEMIKDAFDDIDEPKSEFWINRMFKYYSGRLHYLKTDYVAFLGSMDDDMVCGHYADGKSKRYCLMIRDKAREYLEMGKICAA